MPAAGARLQREPCQTLWFTLLKYQPAWVCEWCDKSGKHKSDCWMAFSFYWFRFAHPYQYELDHFTPPDSVLQKPEPQVSADLSWWWFPGSPGISRYINDWMQFWLSLVAFIVLGWPKIRSSFPVRCYGKPNEFSGYPNRRVWLQIISWTHNSLCPLRKDDGS